MEEEEKEEEGGKEGDVHIEGSNSRILGNECGGKGGLGYLG